MAAMMTDDDGPPADVVDGVQSTMNGLVDKAGGAVAAEKRSRSSSSEQPWRLGVTTGRPMAL